MMRQPILFVLALVLGALATSAFAQEPAYFVNAQVVRGSENPTGPVCVVTPAFKTSEQIVWLAEVYDADTGEKLTPEQVEERGVTAKAVLEDGSEYEMEYDLHPREEPQIHLFAGAWVIPPVYPTGQLYFEIVIEDDEGNSVTWTQLGDEREGGYPSMITIEQR